MIDTAGISYDTAPMAMGKRTTRSATVDVVTTTDVADSDPSLYWRLNQLPCEHGFDDFAEGQCATVLRRNDRPAVAPTPIASVASTISVKVGVARKLCAPSGAFGGFVPRFAGVVSSAIVSPMRLARPQPHPFMPPRMEVRSWVCVSGAFFSRSF